MQMKKKRHKKIRCQKLKSREEFLKRKIFDEENSSGAKLDLKMDWCQLCLPKTSREDLQLCYLTLGFSFSEKSQKWQIKCCCFSPTKNQISKRNEKNIS